MWQWKEQSGSTITRQLRRLGASPDWSRERFTMDEGLSAAVRKVFVRLYREGLIYRDKRLVNWDPKLHTGISDLEVENVETKGSLWYFRYPVEGRTSIHRRRDDAARNHARRYRRRGASRRRALQASHRQACRAAAGRAAHSDCRRRICRPDKGTGAVKITPAHDFNDFEVGRRHNLPLINIFDRDAQLNDDAPEAYRGLDRFEARKQIVADMEALGLSRRSSRTR